MTRKPPTKPPKKLHEAYLKYIEKSALGEPKRTDDMPKEFYKFYEKKI